MEAVATSGAASAYGRLGAIGPVALRPQACRRVHLERSRQGGRARSSAAAADGRQGTGRQQFHSAARRRVGLAPPADRLLVVIASAAAAPTTAPASSAPPSQPTDRGHRLEAMIQMRKLYRNVLRAEALVGQPAPVYQAPASRAATTGGSSSNGGSANGGGGDAATSAAELEEAEEAQRRVDEAVEIVAEMELTAEQLKAGLRALRACPYPYPQLFTPDMQGKAAELLEERVNTLFEVLSERARQETSLLPFPTEAAAHAAIDARNARFRLSIPWAPAGSGEQGAEGGDAGSGSGGVEGGPGLSERLVKAEKAAEQFVARRLQPAVQRVKQTSPEGVVQGLKSSAVWAKGVWNRLNGSPGQQLLGRDSSLGLPLPPSSEEGRKAAIQQLNIDLDALEKKLQEASKARETRLRKAGLQGRARMAAELRDMDNDIAALSKALAVRTLQLEMEYVCGALEDEARDVVGDAKVAGSGDDGLRLALARNGSSDEVALLIAEFRLLDEQLGGMAAAVEAEEALFVDDGELARLASDIPDLRLRLGIGETEVFGGQGFSLVKLQMQIREGVVKVVDGVMFGVRGVKLLFADIGSAGKLFWRAVRGGTLKPREVQALRRTVRDLLSFVPFTIILIVPLTPVGHVLIFGFIQRYFPGFFPSQFTGRRQELMVKYDELKRQLRDAELQAEAENDELEYRQKTAAAMAVLGRGAAMAAAAPAAAVATAVLGGELEAAVAVGAAAAAAAAAIGGGNDPTAAVLEAAEAAAAGGEEEEGPAAKAVRQIEEKLVAAEDETYTADVEEGEEWAAEGAAQAGGTQQQQTAAGTGAGTAQQQAAGKQQPAAKAKQQDSKQPPLGH